MSWKELLTEVRPKDHLVELYENDESLSRRVSHYLREGLRRDEAVVAIATRPHRISFTEQLARDEVDVDAMLARRQLIVLDAEETLHRFMIGDHPDPARFQEALRATLDGAPAASRGLRLYGEMVDVLWRDGNVSGALHLEHLWHQLLHRRELPLLCAYRIDILDRANHHDAFQSVLAIHSHLIPVGSGDLLEKAVLLAMEEVLGREKAAALLPLVAAAQYPRIALCRAEAALIWITRALTSHAGAIFARARLHYAALCTDREGG
jgi:hypothetical protein